MSDLSISSFREVDFYTIRNVLSSSTLTEADKIKFLTNNHDSVKAVLKTTLSSEEYDLIMHNRPLLRGRPLKNIYTKRGDKILLAETLGIPYTEIEPYLENAVNKLENPSDLNNLSDEHMKALKTYAYRHGNKKQVLAFLDYELSHTIDIKATLQKTLDYGKGGIADYFNRPAHTLDNKTMINVFNTIDKYILDAQKKGLITTADTLDMAQWVFSRICFIQNNSRFIRKK